MPRAGFVIAVQPMRTKLSRRRWPPYVGSAPGGEAVQLVRGNMFAVDGKAMLIFAGRKASHESAALSLAVDVTCTHKRCGAAKQPSAQIG
jgi:hypothetical protein